MVRVEVKLLGVLQWLAGKSEHTVELNEPATVASLVQRLRTIFGPKFRNALSNPELKDPRLRDLILVNDQHIGLLQGLETKLRDGNTITIIPVYHGG